MYLVGRRNYTTFCVHSVSVMKSMTACWSHIEAYCTLFQAPFCLLHCLALQHGLKGLGLFNICVPRQKAHNEQLCIVSKEEKSWSMFDNYVLHQQSWRRHRNLKVAADAGEEQDKLTLLDTIRASVGGRGEAETDIDPASRKLIERFSLSPLKMIPFSLAIYLFSKTCFTTTRTPFLEVIFWQSTFICIWSFFSIILSYLLILAGILLLPKPHNPASESWMRTVLQKSIWAVTI